MPPTIMLHKMMILRFFLSDNSFILLPWKYRRNKGNVFERRAAKKLLFDILFAEMLQKQLLRSDEHISQK